MTLDINLTCDGRCETNEIEAQQIFMHRRRFASHL